MTEQNAGPTGGEPPASRSDGDHSERTIWWAIFAVGVVVFFAIILLGRPLVEGRLTAARNLDRATAMIAGTDGDLATIDLGVRDSSAAGGTGPARETLAVIERTRITLGQAAVLSETGFDRLTQDEQKRAVIVKATATTRIEVLDAAEAVLSAGPPGASAAVGVQRLDDYEKAVEEARQADAALVKL